MMNTHGVIVQMLSNKFDSADVICLSLISLPVAIGSVQLRHSVIFTNVKGPRLGLYTRNRPAVQFRTTLLSEALLILFIF